MNNYTINLTKPTISPNSVIMENVTTCYAPGSNVYMLDFNGKTVPGGITLNKCLFGMGKDARKNHHT